MYNMKPFSYFKSILLLGCAIVCASSSNAQDIIQLKNGDEIEAKVLSIAEKEVVYKKFQNLNGPDRTMPISDILFIRYENGKKEVFSQQAATEAIASQTINENNPLTDELFKKNLAVEEARRNTIGKNNLRLRGGIGLGIGSSTSNDYVDLNFVGGIAACEVMWLHTIADYTGNFGIGFGIQPFFGTVDGFADDAVNYSGLYSTIPLQIQHVARNGITFGFIITPAIAVSQNISKGSYKINDEDYSDAFAKFRLGLHAELGYNYKHWDFGVRTGMWIGNYVKGFSSTITYDIIGLSIGYRIKLN